MSSNDPIDGGPIDPLSNAVAQRIIDKTAEMRIQQIRTEAAIEIEALKLQIDRLKTEPKEALLRLSQLLTICDKHGVEWEELNEIRIFVGHSSLNGTLEVARKSLSPTFPQTTSESSSGSYARMALAPSFGKVSIVLHGQAKGAVMSLPNKGAEPNLVVQLRATNRALFESMELEKTLRREVEDLKLKIHALKEEPVQALVHLNRVLQVCNGLGIEDKRLDEARVFIGHCALNGSLSEVDIPIKMVDIEPSSKPLTITFHATPPSSIMVHATPPPLFASQQEWDDACRSLSDK